MNSFLRAISFFALIISSGCAAGKADSSFQIFWTEFRAAAIQNDYKTLEKFTKFPLEIRGPDDSMPTEYLKKDDFNDVFDRIMQQKTYLPHDDDSLIETSMREIVDNTLLISDAKKGEEYQIEQLVFEFVDGQWFFTKAYLDDL